MSSWDEYRAYGVEEPVQDETGGMTEEEERAYADRCR